MKKLIVIIALALIVVPAGLAWWFFVQKPSPDTQAIDILALRKKAYDSYQQGRYEESVTNFSHYLAGRPADAQANYDYAVLLAQLGRHAEAVTVLENLHRLNPAREAAYFKLGGEYVILQREADAEKVFTELQASANRDIATAAGEALGRLKADQAQKAKFEAEAEIYRLAREYKHEEIIAAVDKLEQQGDLSYEMEMQRLYALGNLQKYAPALERAERLAVKYPEAADLALVRAELLMQLGRKDEAIALWRRIRSENPGSSAAIAAGNRLKEYVPEEGGGAAVGKAELPKASDEEVVYSLASRQKYRELVQVIDEMQLKHGTVSWDLEMQRLYALQSLGESNRAIEVAARLAQERPKSVEVAMLRADLLVNAQRWEEASVVLKRVKQDNPETPVAREAQRRLEVLPGVCNVDKNNWGELYASGDYHDRYDTLIGSGFIRAGTYVPHARWLQPYVGMRFSLDTQSGAGSQQTIIQDNNISFVGGVRAQLFATEYLFLYVEGGINKDLLDRRHRGDWAWDYQGGIYGFKSWGPGVMLKDLPAGTNAAAQAESESYSLSPVTWRGDWLVDVGADFSYYHRYDSWLGYGQAHEGYRLAQLGRNVGLDAYLMENVAWDVQGNYFDNLFEVGPGLRLLWTPWTRRMNRQVSLRAEWVEGFYFGRDDLDLRGNASSRYDDFRVSLSVGGSW